jgi:hypothetical protein
MSGHDHAMRSIVPLAVLLGALALLAAGPKATTSEKSVPPAKAAAGIAQRRYTTETVRGRVVWLDEALARWGVTTDPEAAHTSVVLQTPKDQLLPLVPDVRGRAFAVDEHLRNIDLELLVRRYEGAPLLQVIRVFERKPDGLYEIDYWCDICAIPMFILKPCECCQGPTRLRERRVEDQADLSKE